MQDEPITESEDSKVEVGEVIVEDEAKEPPAQEPAKEPEVQEQQEEPVVTPPPTPEPEPIIVEPTLPPPPAPEPPKPPVKDEPVAEEPVDKTEDRSTKVEDDAGSEPKVESTLPVVETPPTTPPIAPAVHDPKYTKDIPQKVLELTPEEINAARLLWAREHIGAAQAQANRNRTARMNERMSEIEKIVRGKPQISVHEIAKSVGLSEKLTSGYLQKLVHGGRLHATGNSWNRRFF